MAKVYHSRIYPNKFNDQLTTVIPHWLMKNVKNLINRKTQVKQATEKFIMGLHQELLPMRKERDEAIMSRKQFKEKRRFNQLSDKKRVIWMVYEDDNTPCTKIAKYFDKFVKNELLDYKHQYSQILTDLNNQYEEEEGGIDDAGYRTLFKSKMI